MVSSDTVAGSIELSEDRGGGVGEWVIRGGVPGNEPSV